MLPIVQALMANGLTLLGNAVLAKGKDVVEEKLGVKLSPAPTQAELIQLRQLELEHEDTLLSMQLEDKKLTLEENKNARDMNARIQESANASTIAKNAAYILDFIIVCVTLIMAYTIIWTVVPVENKELFYTAFGSLLTLCGTIVNFHRGSTNTNKEKDATILRMVSAK